VSTTGSDISIVLCTCPEAAASDLATTVVGEMLAACVNILPTVRSIYRWDGAVQDDAEALLVMKTTAAGYDALQARVLELHPYDVPEVIALPVAEGSAAYLQWVTQSVGPGKE